MNEQHTAPDPTASHPELGFFNGLSATLRLELDARQAGRPPVQRLRRA